jgi:hypothetical protein
VARREEAVVLGYRDEAAVLGDRDEQKEGFLDEAPPPLSDDEAEDWDEEDEDRATGMRATVDDQLGTFVAMVGSLLPRHGHFYERRGPTFGADRQRRVIALARAAIITGSNVYGVLHAKEAAKEWTFDPAQISEDEAFLRKHGYLSKAAQARWDALQLGDKGRLSVARVKAMLSPDNPEYHRMMELAASGGGVPVPVPPDFIPNGSNGGKLPTMSQATRLAAGALRKMVWKGFRDTLLCFVVGTVFARAFVLNGHFSPPVWAPKAGDVDGRNCNHCSNGGKEPGNQPLNSEWLTDWARAHYGAIQHPTIEDIVAMLVRFKERMAAEGKGEEPILLWKMDIKGAYTLLTYRAEDVHLMGMELPGEVTAFFMGGTFGWGAMPFCFQVVTRAVLWELNKGTRHKLRGEALMYVDDIIAASLACDVAHDQSTVTALVDGLLGDGAMSQKKTVVETDGVLDAIGYRIDRINELVGISENNTHKAFYAAWDVGDGTNVTVTMMEKVAAHAARYKRVCPFMAAFTSALFGSIRGRTNRKLRFALAPLEMAAVQMMRILLILTAVAGVAFTRSFRSFTMREHRHTWVLEYDASLTAIAILWFRMVGDVEVGVGYCVVNIESLGLNGMDDRSKFMNFAEFLAATLAVRGLIGQGVTNQPVMVRGDNMAALTWATKKSFRSEFASRTAMVHITQNVRAGIEIVVKEHLPHLDAYDYNWRCDLPSRGKTWDDVFERDKDDKITGQRLHRENMTPWEIPDAQRILELCDPRVGRGDDGVAFVRRVLETV